MWDGCSSMRSRIRELCVRALRASALIPICCRGSPLLSNAMARFSGVMIPRRHGMQLVAKPNLPRKAWNAGSVQYFLGCCNAAAMAAEYLDFFASRIPTTRPVPVAPWNSKPRSSSVILNLASPLSSFFSDTLSFPPTLPVTSGGGKTAWMACMVALESHRCIWLRVVRDGSPPAHS